MLDRQKLEILLARRFKGATTEQIATAANAIMGLEDEWEEMTETDDFGYQLSPRCGEICALAREAESGAEFRLLRRRTMNAGPERAADHYGVRNGR
jgi:hypothetical protein